MVEPYHPSIQDRFRRRTRRALLERMHAVVEPEGTRLLDLGGGTGVTTVEFGRGAREVVVLEPDAGKVARGRRAAAPVTFVTGVAECVPFGDARFDRVTSMMSYHHFADGAKACREAARSLAPGGRFIVYDIPRSSFHAGWLSLFARGRGHSALAFVTPPELELRLRDAGFRSVRREPYRSGTFVIGER